jgi:hypothetical protein
MGSKLTYGTTADHYIPQENGGYNKQQYFDQDTVHAVIGTHSLANNSISVAEMFLQNFQFTTNHMDNNSTYTCI